MKKLHSVLAAVTTSLLMASAPAYADKADKTSAETVDEIPMLFGEPLIPLEIIQEQKAKKSSKHRRSAKRTTAKKAPTDVTALMGNHVSLKTMNLGSRVQAAPDVASKVTAGERRLKRTATVAEQTSGVDQRIRQVRLSGAEAKTKPVKKSAKEKPLAPSVAGKTMRARLP